MDPISRCSRTERPFSSDDVNASSDPEVDRKKADRAAEERWNQMLSVPLTDARGASKVAKTPVRTDDWSAAKKESERTRKLDKPLEPDPLGDAVLGLSLEVAGGSVQWLGLKLAKALLFDAIVGMFKPTPSLPDEQGGEP